MTYLFDCTYDKIYITYIIYIPGVLGFRPSLFFIIIQININIQLRKSPFSKNCIKSFVRYNGFGDVLIMF